MNSSPSLKKRLTIYFIFVAVFPILTVAIVTFKNLNTKMKNEVIQKNELLSKRLADYVEQFLNEPMTLLYHLNDVIHKEKQIPEENINSYLSSLIKNYKIFDVIKILDHNGIVQYMAPFDENMLRLDFSHKKYFQKTINQRKFS